MATNVRGRATRQRLLDAAEQVLASRGTDVTMEEVADAAGITRSTVYRHVASRDELITEVVLRSSRRAADRLVSVIDGPGPFADRLADAMVTAIGIIRDTPHLRAVVTAGDTGSRWPGIDPDDRFLDAVFAFFRPRLAAAVADEGVVLRSDVDDTLDWLLRQALLPLLVSSRRGTDDDALRHDIATFVLPGALAAGTTTATGPGPARH